MANVRQSFGPSSALNSWRRAARCNLKKNSFDDTWYKRARRATEMAFPSGNQFWPSCATPEPGIHSPGAWNTLHVLTPSWSRWFSSPRYLNAIWPRSNCGSHDSSAVYQTATRWQWWLPRVLQKKNSKIITKIQIEEGSSIWLKSASRANYLSCTIFAIRVETITLWPRLLYILFFIFFIWIRMYAIFIIVILYHYYIIYILYI